MSHQMEAPNITIKNTLARFPKQYRKSFTNVMKSIAIFPVYERERNELMNEWIDGWMIEWMNEWINTHNKQMANPLKYM